MSPADLLQAARAAAEALQGVEGASVSLGWRLDVATMDALAAMVPGAERSAFVSLSAEPQVLESIDLCLSGVGVHGQGRRAVTAADTALRGCMGGATHLTPEQTQAALARGGR